MTTAWVERRRRWYAVAVVCRALGVSRSGSYARARRPAGAAAARRAESAARTGEAHAGVRGRYGGPRVHAESNARGVACRVNAVAKRMRRAGVREGVGADRPRDRLAARAACGPRRARPGLRAGRA